MSVGYPYGLFQAYGLELEYMIVDATTLDVQPIADRLLGLSGDLDRGGAVWSNELALHVFEMKVGEPAPSLVGLGEFFQAEVSEVNRRLARWEARLLPTGMHPWMDPGLEFRCWPHQNDDVYAAFDRIFDCRGHGWSNLQSVHLNLPFADDAQFGRLHAAARLVLPLLPALAASSPFREGQATGFLDTRLEVYRGNAAAVPSVGGALVPEPVYTRSAYETEILERIYRDLEPLDPEGILRHEWVNSRGAIARFDRGSLEIRVLDMQECPRADLAVAGATAAVVQALAEERFTSFREQAAWDAAELAALLPAAFRDADGAVLENPAYLAQFGYPGERAEAREVWAHLIETVVTRSPAHPEWADLLDLYLRKGCLARRIREATGDRPSRTRLAEVYRGLADCLAHGRFFPGADVANSPNNV